jgi:hypothetical protein
LSDSLRATGARVKPELSYESQPWTANLGTPDIVGVDHAKRERIIIEGKFWAGLTASQPMKYLKRLRKSRNGALLFVAPSARMNSLWDELLQRVSSQSPRLIRTRSCVSAAKLRAGTILALTDWSHVLEHIKERLRKEGDRPRAADVRQILSLCDYHEDEQRVLSIPAAKSIEFIHKTRIHACPARGRYSTYQKTRYVAFRSKGGVMTEIYEIDMITKFRPQAKCIPRWIKPTIHNRLSDYIDLRREQWSFGSSRNFTFYVLSPKIKFKLRHAPRIDAQGHCYFDLADLRNEKVPRLASSKELE